MKVTYTTGGETPTTVAVLSLENTGVNRFRASIPVQDGAGRVYSRTAEIEAASERTKAGTMRIMLKCTIPYLPQMLDENGVALIDSAKSPKPYTLHIVHTIPAIMVNEALNNALANQAAQVAAIASQIINLGTLTGTIGNDDPRVMANVPLQVDTPSVDGEASYPLTSANKSGAGTIAVVTNVTSSALAGSFLGRALAGLMPIDINSDKAVALKASLS